MHFRTVLGEELKVPSEIARRSPTVESLLRLSALGSTSTSSFEAEDSFMEVPLFDVEIQEARRVMEFLALEKDNGELLIIKRKLQSFDLEGAGLPEWAIKFIMAVPLLDTVPLFRAANHFQVHMLSEGLCAIRVAQVVTRAGAVRFREMFEKVKLTQEEETELRTKNPFAWKDPTTDLHKYPDVAPPIIVPASAPPAGGGAPAVPAPAGGGAPAAPAPAGGGAPVGGGAPAAPAPVGGAGTPVAGTDAAPAAVVPPPYPFDSQKGDPSFVGAEMEAAMADIAEILKNPAVKRGETDEKMKVVQPMSVAIALFL